MPPFPFKKPEFQDSRLTRDPRKFTVRFQTERRSFSLGRLCLPRSNDCHWFNVQGATGKMVYEELSIHWFPKPKTLSSLGLSKHIRSGNLSSSHNLSTDTLWLWTTPMIKIIIIIAAATTELLLWWPVKLLFIYFLYSCPSLPITVLNPHHSPLVSGPKIFMWENTNSYSLNCCCAFWYLQFLNWYKLVWVQVSL